jgi:eukaryotic-like serine/threonine-protein kinase
VPGDTTRTRHLAEQRVGTRLDGKWFLDSLLGFGGSAAVYAATHRNGMRGAVKILHPHCVADEQLRTRFVREGYVANKIGHPGAVTVLDDDTASDGTVYLVMELLEGRSLERLRADGSTMSVAEVIRVADDLLDVLIKAHAQGIIHRDIKPANIFVTHAGQLKVLDFGIARLGEAMSSLDGSPATQTGLMMGTPAFMPPEQARARWDEVDARSDLWAVGTTMIALMLGRRPRVADTPNEELLLAMTQAMPKVATLLPHVPRNIAYVFDRACEFNRNDRWPSAGVMQEALRAAARESEPTIAAAKDNFAMGNSIAVPIITTTVVAPMTPHPAPVPPQFTAMASVPAQAPSGPSLSPNTGPHPAVISGLAGSVIAPPPSHQDMIESPPSLTTNRAVLHHTGPPPSKGAGRAVLISLIAVFAVVLIAGSGLYVKYNGLPMRQAPAATADPSPSPSPSPPPTSDTPPDPPPTSSVIGASTPNPPTTSASPGTTSTGVAAKTTTARPPQPAHPPPRPAASPQASAYFNDRF